MRNVVFFFIISFLFISCKEKGESPCAENIICTEEFIHITVTVENGEGNPVMLDNFYTFIDSRTRIELDRSDFQFEKGIYPVVTDANKDLIEFEGTNVVFVGELDGKNVVEHPMIISKDCCHIKLVKGETKIIKEEL